MAKNAFIRYLRLSLDRFWAWPYRNYALVSLFFLVWIGFLSPNTIGNQIRSYRELRELKKTKAFYLQEIQYHENLIQRLKSDPSFVERFGRETYLMKRDEEDIYIFE